MLKLTFILLDDINSNNTINILQYILSNIDVINSKNAFVNFVVVKNEDISTDKFTSFRTQNNIQSIPSIIVEDGNRKKTISSTDNIKDFLTSFINTVNNAMGNNTTSNNATSNNAMGNNATSNNAMGNNATRNRAVSNNNTANELMSDASSDVDGEITEYMTNEVCSKNYDGKEDFLSSGHDDGDLMKKMKDFGNKKTGDISAQQNTNDNRSSIKFNTPLTTDEEYGNKLFERATKRKSTSPNINI